jgi:hypothetical protein
MTTVHEEIILCGEALDHSEEAEYRELRAALKAYINKNARRDFQLIGPDYDAITKTARVRSVTARILQTVRVPTLEGRIAEALAPGAKGGHSQTS